MKTLLVGLDNPYSRNPEHALLPMPDGATGDHLVKLIGTVHPNYSRSRFLADFGRCNLYPGVRANSGKGTRSMDRLMARWCFLYARDMGAMAVVLLGKRVRLAFAEFVQVVGSDVDLEQYDMGRRMIAFYGIPHPSGRNLWYNFEGNCDRVARLLESLREPNWKSTGRKQHER